MGELKEVTLSQQLFVLNLVLFLNFHVKIYPNLEHFFQKWLITRKIGLFYQSKSIKVKHKFKTFIENLSYLSILLNIRVLLPLWFCYLFFFDIAVWMEGLAALRKYFNIVLPWFYSSWVKFFHCYAPNYRWRLSRVFLKSFPIFL